MWTESKCVKNMQIFSLFLSLPLSALFLSLVRLLMAKRRRTHLKISKRWMHKRHAENGSLRFPVASKRLEREHREKKVPLGLHCACDAIVSSSLFCFCSRYSEIRKKWREKRRPDYALPFCIYPYLSSIARPRPEPYTSDIVICLRFGEMVGCILISIHVSCLCVCLVQCECDILFKFRERFKYLRKRRKIYK